MSMFSEIAIEGVIKNICKTIEQQLQTVTDPGEIRGLKFVGRHALTLFHAYPVDTHAHHIYIG